jgi:hypothetical protein
MRSEAIHALDYAIERALYDLLRRREENLLSGQPQDFAAYREQVGEIRGIQLAINELIASREKLGLNEDEDR